MIQTYPDPDSPKKPDDFSLEDIPLTLKIARRRKLEEEANDVMDLLIKFHGSPHVSSVNLMTCMGSLALIAKTRPQFMPGVMQGIPICKSAASSNEPSNYNTLISSFTKITTRFTSNVIRFASN